MTLPAIRQRLGAELDGLSQVVSQHGVVAHTDSSWSFRPHSPTGLGVRVEFDRDLQVVLATWQYVHRAHDQDDDLEAAEEWLALGLDLVGGALFGRVRVSQVEVDGRVASATATVQSRGQTIALDHQPGPLLARLRGAFAGRRQLYVNALDAPSRYAPSDVAKTGLAWARWAGIAGFWHSDGPVWNRSGAGEVAVAIDGVLDLHQYKPNQVKAVVRSYLDACAEAGVTEVRIIHGKGKGTLRRTVHALLERDNRVAGFRLGRSGEGSWGATIVDLKQDV